MDIRVDVRGGTWVLLAALCLVLPLDWLLAALLAAVFHECCHLLTVFLLGGSIRTLTVGTGGAVMEASAMTPSRQLICVLAGPVGSLSLLLLRSAEPILSVCGMAQGLFNLLPMYPLDGGRALCILTDMLFSSHAARRICDGVFFSTLLGLLAVGCWGTFGAGLGISPLFFVLVFVLTAGKQKILAKKGIREYNKYTISNEVSI